MFEVLKVYVKKTLGMDAFIKQISVLGYSRVDQTFEEGDFTVKGDTIEICPVNFDLPVRIHWEWDRVEAIYTFERETGRKVIAHDVLLLIGPHRTKAYTEDIPLDTFVDFKEGDFVVHNQYGIGRLRGKKIMGEEQSSALFFEVEYRDSDRLYIPAEKSELLQKYINFGLRAPKLSRLGTKEWLRIKEKARSGIRAFALEMVRTQAAREVVSAFRFSRDTEWQKKFEDTFPYRLTACQQSALSDTKSDMEHAKAMDRLICGDVGFGKTEVALRAAFKAVMDNKQVAILVPTTLLAYQYYTLLGRRVADFPVRVEMLSRLRTPAEQVRILRDVREGKIDVMVATHRLLSEDVSFKDLGLLIIDEEQKFGVVQKEKIKKIALTVDVLTLSATPIPRTLYMALIEIKGISLIKTPPEERLAVKTHVEPFSPALVREVILKEKNRGGQVFFIHNRIEDIHRIEKLLKTTLPPSLSVAVAHGRLPPRSIERMMLDFIQGKTDCLLSTVIIESGIDIPNANTIIINNAHAFGLADLHQLRGRVGRFNRQAYAYFLIPRRGVLEEARKRLDAICEFSHLGAGFQIALRDLELRGAGNILGTHQHGFVWSVGLDLYCRILKEETEKVKNVLKR